MYVHGSVFIVTALLALIAIGNPLMGLLFVASYLGIIVIHEFGHAAVAVLRGCSVNSIWIGYWHGWCVVDASEFEWDHVLIAWGGAAAQTVVAIPCIALSFLLGDSDWSYLTPIIVFLGYFNLVWAIVNLLPGDESDGRTAWRIIPLYRQLLASRRSASSAVERAQQRWRK